VYPGFSCCVQLLNHLSIGNSVHLDGYVTCSTMANLVLNQLIKPASKVRGRDDQLVVLALTPKTGELIEES